MRISTHVRLRVAVILWLLFLPVPKQAAAMTLPGWLGFADAPVSVRIEGEITDLELAKPIERELAADQSHRYRISAKAGQYLRVMVEQKGIDVVLVAHAPDSRVLETADSPNGTDGPETLSLVAIESGDYLLAVQSLYHHALPGRYRIVLTDLRESTANDISRVAAERFLRKAHLLREKATPESLREAVENYKQACSRFSEAADIPGEAESLVNLGEVHSTLVERTEAVDCYNKALAKAQHLGDAPLQARVFRGLAAAHFGLRNKDQALSYYHKALAIKKSSGDSRGEAQVLNDIGWIYKASNDPDNALGYFKQALGVSHAARDKQLEATSLHNIALVHIDRGEYQIALDCYARALPLKQAAGDWQGEGAVLNAIANIYLLLGANQKSIEFFNQVLPLWRRIGDPRWEAVVLNNIGSAHAGLREYEKALEYFNRSILLYQKTLDRGGEATARLGVSRTQLSLGNFQKAIDCAGEVLVMAEGLGDLRLQAVASSNIGLAYYRLGALEKGLIHLERALFLSTTIQNLVGQAEAQAGIARIEQTRGNIPKARADIEAALTKLESLRGKVASRDLRASYFASIRPYYEFYIDLLMQLHDLEPSAGHGRLAFEVSERARARTLVETLNEWHADIRRGADPRLVEQERSLMQLISRKSMEQIRLLGGKHTAEQAAAARKEIDMLLGRLDEVEAQIRNSSPKYAALTQPARITLEQVQQQVLDPDTALLEYLLGDTHSYLWFITADSISSFRLPARAVIEKSARRLYAALTARQRHYGVAQQERANLVEADAELEKASAELSEMLLGPVAGNLASRRLIIAGDGALQFIPFGALAKPDGLCRPLLETNEIVGLPSGAALALLRQESGRRKIAPKRIAIIADPVFEKDDVRVQPTFKSGKRSEQRSRRNARVEEAGYLQVTDESESRRVAGEARLTDAQFGFPRLVVSREEANNIAAVASSGGVMKALDFKASLETVMSPELSDYRILHFATHGLLDTESPELSALVLSLVDEQGSVQNGFLRLYEIYNLNLQADLVVLSACQTGLGKEIKGEGIIGLTRGFMYAGAKRVVAALWKVDDDATAELMREFYTRMLKKGERPSAALRAAQLAIRKQPQWSSPFYWAPFVIQGEYR